MVAATGRYQRGKRYDGVDAPGARARKRTVGATGTQATKHRCAIMGRSRQIVKRFERRWGRAPGHRPVACRSGVPARPRCTGGLHLENRLIGFRVADGYRQIVEGIGASGPRSVAPKRPRSDTESFLINKKELSNDHLAGPACSPALRGDRVRCTSPVVRRRIVLLHLAGRVLLGRGESPGGTTSIGGERVLSVVGSDLARPFKIPGTGLTNSRQPGLQGGWKCLALMRAGDDPAGYFGLFVQVVTGTDPVVAVSDPQGYPLHQQHRESLSPNLTFLKSAATSGSSGGSNARLAARRMSFAA